MSTPAWPVGVGQVSCFPGGNRTCSSTPEPPPRAVLTLHFLRRGEACVGGGVVLGPQVAVSIRCPGKYPESVQC